MAEQTSKQQHIRFNSGEIILRTERDRFAYNTWHFAPARRAGDFIYVSGVIVSRRSDVIPSAESFAAALRPVFESLRAQIDLYGATLQDIVKLTTFHDWAAPEFGGDRQAQATAFQAVKDEFISEPHPSWTAVGTTGLVRNEGILEMEAVVFCPTTGA